MINWLIDWLIEWLSDWVIDWLSFKAESRPQQTTYHLEEYLSKAQHICRCNTDTSVVCEI